MTLRQGLAVFPQVREGPGPWRRRVPWRNRKSEDTLGRALAGITRDSYVMVTKGNHDLSGQGLNPAPVDDPDTAIASVEPSLERLRTDSSDVLLVHGLQVEQYTEKMSRLGFEPRTLGLKVRCSDQLSYRPSGGGKSDMRSRRWQGHILTSRDAPCALTGAPSSRWQPGRRHSAERQATRVCGRVEDDLWTRGPDGPADRS